MRKEFLGLISMFVLATAYFLIPPTIYSQSITLSWNPNPEPDIKYYTIYKSQSASDMKNLAQIPATELTYVDRDIVTGEIYYYRITAVDSAGNTSKYSEEIKIPAVPIVTGTGEVQLPQRFSLSQNYPNPFNPETEFDYTVPEAGQISLIIYDILGRAVKTLFNGHQQPGTHNIKWNGTDESSRKVASGVYVARFVAGKFAQVRKLILQK